jgi:hypothetical protein
MNAPIVLVQMADTKWTTAAVEAACEHARENNGEVVLAKMLPANYLNWLGMEAIEYQFTESDCDDIVVYEEIARRCGVPVRTMVVKYENLEDGLANAADETNAEAVIAHVPGSPIPFLHNRPVQRLDTLLEAHRHHLYTVEQPAAPVNWKPEVTPFHN